MPRPISATIHTAALANNLSVVRRFAGPSKVWAVVKANAYGHGLARVFPGLRGTDGFGLLDLDEAVKLRELGWAGPILLLEGFFRSTDIDVIDRYSLTTTVHNDEQMRMLETARLSKPVNVQLKMNSGMNRLGYQPEKYRAAWERARACPAIGQITLMTHFSDADTERGVAEQLATFERGAENIAGARSLANSAAVLWHPDTHFDWVRPGIVLYGASPSGLSADIADTGLQPTMTLTSELIAVQTIAKGQAIGYGRRSRRRPDAHRRRRVRLRGRLSARRARRHAGDRRRGPHADRRPRVDGHDHRRPDPVPAGRRRRARRAVGQHAADRRRRAPLRNHRL